MHRRRNEARRAKRRAARPRHGRQPPFPSPRLRRV